MINRKGFKMDPVNDPVSVIVGDQEAVVVDPVKAPECKTEMKTRRVQLYLQPSIVLEVKTVADSMNLSVNELVSRLLKLTLKQKEEDPEKFYTEVIKIGMGGNLVNVPIFKE